MDSDVTEEVVRIGKILRKNFKMHASIEVSEEISQSSETTLPPPPFEATHINPLFPSRAFPVDIYLGNVSDAMYPAALAARNIGAVLNMALSQCVDFQRVQKMMADDGPPSQWELIRFDEGWYRRGGFEYLGIPAEDHPKYKISDHFEECFSFIDRVGSRGILIHCIQGLNRSAAVVAAWLLRGGYGNLSEIVERLSFARPGKLLSNRGFVRELVVLERKMTGVGEPQGVPQRQIFSIGNVVERNVT
jgi:hypothetical protein